MDFWQWLTWGLAAIGIIAILVSLDRLCLWLEDRGWLYYRRKKPTSSPMSALVAIQQFIEPGLKHVVEVRHEKRSAMEIEADKERILAMLIEILQSTPVNVEAVRLYLSSAKNLGLDWQALYQQAVQVELHERPYRASLPPSLATVAPED